MGTNLDDKNKNNIKEDNMVVNVPLNIISLNKIKSMVEEKNANSSINRENALKLLGKEIYASYTSYFSKNNVAQKKSGEKNKSASLMDRLEIKTMPNYDVGSNNQPDNDIDQDGSEYVTNNQDNFFSNVGSISGNIFTNSRMESEMDYPSYHQDSNLDTIRNFNPSQRHVYDTRDKRYQYDSRDYD